MDEKMDEKIIEDVKKMTALISHLYGWNLEVKKSYVENEIILAYEQREDDTGLPGNIMKMLLSDLEAREFVFSRIGLGDKNTIYFIFWYNPEFMTEYLKSPITEVDKLC